LPEADEWRLALGSPEVRVEGPKAVYRRVQTALARLGSTLPLSSIAVVDSSEPLVRSLAENVRIPGISGVRWSRNTVNGHYIEDAFIYRSVA
jgi:hypothetical protein